MPFYEFGCNCCKSFFEITSKRPFDVESTLCVECGSPDVELKSQNDERGIRLDQLIKDVASITGRVAVLEDFFNDITGEVEGDSGFINIVDAKDDGKRH